MKKFQLLAIAIILCSCSVVFKTSTSPIHAGGSFVELKVEKLYTGIVKDNQNYMGYSFFYASYNGNSEIFLTTRHAIIDSMNISEEEWRFFRRFISLPRQSELIKEKHKYPFRIKERITTESLRAYDVNVIISCFGKTMEDYNVKYGFKKLIENSIIKQKYVYVIDNVYDAPFDGVVEKGSYESHLFFLVDIEMINYQDKIWSGDPDED
jgi:hypothetical protein